MDGGKEADSELPEPVLKDRGVEGFGSPNLVQIASRDAGQSLGHLPRCPLIY